ncbi:tetratricopeptide repeat protein 7B-like [Diaphorina citri]|uniref:Tetratricopeptide repeat protein 7B-like n=1 Tax=Diaphorina citri TaxID=121845 RepID=A0A3Q0IKI6_DIACI|nr:tetratricopeptide repeat protein 7B-like [Diaphorina citri]
MFRFQLAEGIKWVQKALSREQAHPQNLLSRCYLFLGIGYHYSAVNTHVKNKSKTFHSLSQESFLNALKLDPNDHITYYYLGLHAACHADTTEAINYVKQALKLNPEHTASINLMILLLTAQKQVKESLALVESSLMDFPDNLNFSFLKANIELHHVSGEAALQTARHMLTLWKNLYEDQTNSEISDNKSVFQLYTSELSDKDTNSVHTHSLIAAKVEQALSDIASSISSFAPRPGPHKAWQIQLQIWLLLAEIYLTLDQINADQGLIKRGKFNFKSGSYWRRYI